MSDSSFASYQERFANLGDENFLEWKDNMLGLLMARGLLAYIEPLPTNAPAAATDEQKATAATELKQPEATITRAEQQARGLIFLKVEHQQRAHLIDIKTDSARSMWAKICAKHEKVGEQAAISCISGLFETRLHSVLKSR
jgi:hypothetical protein